MKNRLTELLEAYRRRPESKADQSMWRYVVENDPYVFSHHPSSPGFREHVWKVGGLYFCKGCVVTFLGLIFWAGFFAASGWLHWLTDVQVGAIFVTLLLPTLFVHVWRAPRWCKHLARLLLGFLMASAFIMLFVTESWLVRLVIVGSYFAAKIPMERARNRENRRLSQL